MQRITNKMLEAKIAYLNKITNNPVSSYSLDEGGKYKANVGNYHLSQAYGGVCVHQMANEGGGVRTPIVHSHVKKRELFDKLCAFIDGIEYGKKLTNN